MDSADDEQVRHRLAELKEKIQSDINIILRHHACPVRSRPGEAHSQAQRSKGEACRLGRPLNRPLDHGNRMPPSTARRAAFSIATTSPRHCPRPQERDHDDRTGLSI